MGFLITIVAIYLLLFRICWEITKTIIIFIYESTINVLISTGMSVKAARALIAMISITLILWWYFSI